MTGKLINRLSNFISSNPDTVVCAIDLETLVADAGGFLSGESIIGISVAFTSDMLKTHTFVSEEDTKAEEMRILRELDQSLAEISPGIILGYNHTGYDIPLIISKIRNLSYEDRNRNLEYYLGTAWCLDMKYLVAEDLYDYDWYYKIRKLDEVLNHEKYKELETMNVKKNVHIEGLDKGEAIKHLWLNERDKFIQYSMGDSYDLMVLFGEISRKKE